MDPRVNKLKSEVWALKMAFQRFCADLEENARLKKHWTANDRSKPHVE